MSGLEQAVLCELRGSGRNEKAEAGIPVQFNPASLRLTHSNSVEGGKSRGRQVRQYNGKGSSELSFELVFDTAEEIDGSGKHRSVRERTAAVERFVLPRSQGNKKQAPPRVRFHWGDLIIDGVISSLSIDFELFSAGGVPLRAKMNVTIREQDPRYQYGEYGPAANTQTPPPAGGGGGGGNGGGGGGGGGAGGRGGSGGSPGEPGTAGGADPLSTLAAMAGETLADFAARAGLDPSAWRSLADQVEDPLSLAPGAEIGFDPAGVAGAIGRGARAALRAARTPAEALGVASGDSPLERGRALAAAGGVGAALDRVARSANDAAVARERAAFDVPSATPAGGAAPASSPGSGPLAAPAPAAGAARPPAAGPLAQPRPPTIVGTTSDATRVPGVVGHEPLRRFGDAAPGAPAAAAALPPAPDPRASSFGRGLPLRPRVAGAAAVRAALLGGSAALRVRDSWADMVRRPDPTLPSWLRLPPPAADREAADRAQRRTPGSCSCHACRRPGGGSCRCT